MTIAAPCHAVSQRSLVDQAAAVLACADADAKSALSRKAAADWANGRIAQVLPDRPVGFPDRPARPARPELLAPRAMPRRPLTTQEGRVALLHALAHIELNAVDLAWDLIGRFAGEVSKREFFDDWVRVAGEEGKHFAWIQERMSALGATYGDLPAHDGLWEAAQATAHDLLARLAVVPLVLEARGLDASPDMAARLEAADDHESAGLVRRICEEEIGHVAAGIRWFTWVARQRDLTPEFAFHVSVRRHFKGTLKPPFNEAARARAGLTPGFYRPLTMRGNPLES